MAEKNFIALADLEIYKLARELSRLGWEVYRKMDWQTKKVIGDQFITAIDSVGANIAEGYARFHHLDKIKFFYNARASLSEACSHWLELLLERGLLSKSEYDILKKVGRDLSVKLNNFISATYRQININKKLK